MGGDTTQQLKAGLRHSKGIKEYVGVRVSRKPKQELNFIKLKDILRINFSLINWYR
jgi:hypothetical protein